MTGTVLIVGAGSGLSAAVARRFAREGMQVVLAARSVEKLEPLEAELTALSGGRAPLSLACDASDPGDVAALFERCDAAPGAPTVVVYNPSFRVRGAFVELDPLAVRTTLEITAYGGFLVAQQAARRMLASGGGTILFTGASASVKGYALSAPFAMGKFALRGLAQSLARELQPKNIHVAHVVIDGAIASATRVAPAGSPDSMLDPVAIAETYWQLHVQPRSTWSLEVELRPWTERF